MDFCAFLSEEKNYHELLSTGTREVARRSFHFEDDAEDIAAQALENILDYFQRKPNMLLSLEERDEAEMRNYLKKAVRNQVVNILKRKSRERYAQLEITARAIREGLTFNRSAQTDDPPAQQRGTPFYSLLQNFGFYIEDVDHFNVEKMKQELHFFIEEKYGREKWPEKKDIINIYLERFEKNVTLDELRSQYPQRNIRSINAEANRMMKRYLRWVRESEKSRIFCKEKHGEA